MVKIGLADNHPVVHFGIKSYFKEHADISLVGIVDNFEMVEEMLKRKEIDVLLLDLELEGLSSINLIKALLKDFPKVKIVLFSNHDYLHKTTIIHHQGMEMKLIRMLLIS